jgi:hypothetical protein
MQTLLAYAWPGRNAQTHSEGLARVERHYQGLTSAALKHDGMDATAVGLHVWDSSAEHRRWPIWDRDREAGVATLHAPVNYESVVGDVPPERAPLPLARGLLRHPGRVLELGAPFVLSVLDGDHLALLTDAVGLGRLFQLRVPGGWVWTNRPAAAYLFAGIPARADERGWRYHAAVEWFMADSAPLAGMSMVGPATRIEVDGRSGHRLVRQLDPTSFWLSGAEQDPTTPDAVAEVADGLQQVARSAGRLWSERPLIGLSGGRDSRVVTAAFLTAGVDVRVHTNANPQGEADIAGELIRRWPGSVDYAVGWSASTAAPARLASGAVDRTLGWLRMSEGLRPPSYLPKNPPSDQATVSTLGVSGAAGEIAHGHYYPPDVAELQALAPADQLRAYTSRLTRRLASARGPNAAAKAAVAGRIEEVLRQAAQNGANGAAVLDVFYVLERLRRWGTAADKADTLIPLLAPGFVRAAFRLTPQQRSENALHRALIVHMIPAWADVPFYGPGPRPAGPAAPRPPALWEIDSQRELVAAILQEAGDWAQHYDVPQVHAMWRRAVVRAATPGEESILQRVVWRAVFDDYLRQVNAEAPCVRTPIDVRTIGAGPGAEPSAAASRRLRGRLRRSPCIRRAVRSPVGRWLVGSLGRSRG